MPKFPVLSSAAKRFVPYAGEALLAYDAYTELNALLPKNHVAYPRPRPHGIKRGRAADPVSRVVRPRVAARRAVRAMPRFTRARRGRTSRTVRRRAKSRYAKRSRRFRSYRRRVRKTRRKPRTRALRLYPGGAPVTHKVKLRMMTQIHIHSPNASSWGVVQFNPADIRVPMVFSATQQATTPIILKCQTAVLPGAAVPQPYGYDHWIGVADSNKYRKWKVLGSKFALTKVSNLAHPGGTSGGIYWAGFSKLFASSDAYGNTFATTYSNVGNARVGDLLNTAAMRKPQELIKDKLFNKPGNQFLFNYSAKKYARSLYKKGIQDSEWYGTHAASPAVSPKAYFIVADPGVTTTSESILMYLTCEYTVQLSGLRFGGPDT